MEKVLGFIDTYKYQILVILLLILLWRVLAQNIILVVLIAVFVYFIWKENRQQAATAEIKQ